MSHIAVLGAGTMGHALALVWALGGHRVRITDANPATLSKAPGLIAAAAKSLREAGEIDASWTTDRLAQAIQPCATLEETVQGSLHIVEAVVELRDVKEKLYAELDRLLPPEAVIASNTSYLDIFPLMPAARQERTLIVHWYSPPYLVDLVDIVSGPQTLPGIIEDMRAQVLALGKVPVVFKKFIAGYVANRIQEAIQLEVCRLLDDGVVSAEEIDTSVIHGLALRMPILGVVGKVDFAGVDLMQYALANRTYDPPVPTGRSQTVDRLVAEGRTGVKSGKGFYDWGGRSTEELFRERDRRLMALKKAMRNIKPMAVP